MLMGSIRTARSDVLMDAFWNLESIGITDPSWEKDDDQVLILYAFMKYFSQPFIW